MRLSKTVDGVEYTYLYENGLLVQETRGSKVFDYSYDANGRIRMVVYRATADATPETYYYALNSRNDVIGIYTHAGNIFAKYDYDAWGNLLSITNQTGGNLAHFENIATLQPFRYRSYYYDTESGFYYLQSRYYDPVTHRFINADGSISGVGGDIRGYNTYSYCVNNPINMNDINGNWPRWISATIAIAATVVATVTKSSVAVAIAVGATATYGLQVWHYDKRQSKNTNLPETPKQAEDARWKNSNPKTSSNPNGGGPAASCHQYTSKDNTNVKYVSPDGHREVIFDSAGKVVTDPRDIGTYNFKPSGKYWYSKESMEHLFVDIMPWVFFGNSDDDWGPVINFFID